MRIFMESLIHLHFLLPFLGNLFKTAKYLNGNQAHDSYETPNAPTLFCFKLQLFLATLP